jgi:hypothetical protein
MTVQRYSFKFGKQIQIGIKCSQSVSNVGESKVLSCCKMTREKDLTPSVLLRYCEEQMYSRRLQVIDLWFPKSSPSNLYKVLH